MNKITKKREELFKLQFGAFFKTIRESRNLKQTEIATILGVTQGTISKIENGLLVIDLQTYLKFKSLYDVQDYDWQKL